MGNGDASNLRDRIFGFPTLLRDAAETAEAALCGDSIFGHPGSESCVGIFRTRRDVRVQVIAQNQYLELRLVARDIRRPPPAGFILVTVNVWTATGWSRFFSFKDSFDATERT